MKIKQLRSFKLRCLKFAFQGLMLLALGLTAAHAQMVMVQQGFDTSGSLPVGWTTQQLSGTNNWGVVAAIQWGALSPKAGAGFAAKGWSNSDALLISNSFSLVTRASQVARLRGWIWRNPIYDTNDTVTVYVNTATGLAGAVRIGKVFTKSAPNTPAGWEQFEFAVPASFTSATNHFLIRGTTSDGGASYVISLDELSYETYPAVALCPAISLLPVNGLGTNTARLRWLPATGVTGYMIRYRAVGATGVVGSWDSPVTQTDTGFSISTLTAGTEYEFQIATVCAGGVMGSYNNPSGLFNTSFTAPFVETFAAGTRPAGWSLASTTPTNWAFRSTPLPYPELTPAGSLAGADGAGMAWVDSYNFAAGTNSTLNTPSIALPTGQRWLLRYSYAQDQQFTNNDRIQVRISVNGSSAFTPLETVRRLNTSVSRPRWTVSEVDLTAYAGQSVQIRFVTVNEYGNNMAIDAVRIIQNTGLDLAIKIVSPVYNTCPNASSSLAGQLINRGSTTIDFAATPVSVSSSSTSSLNMLSSFPVQTINTGTLAPGAVRDVSLGALNLAFIGTPIFRAHISAVAGDIFAGNDSTRFSLYMPLGIDTLGISQRFAGYTGTNLVAQSDGRWNEGLGPNFPANQDALWTNATFQGRTVASVAMSAAPAAPSWIVGPRFALRPGTRVSFKAAASAALDPNDSLKVMISRDCGQTYQRLYAITNTANALTSDLRNYTVPIFGTANSFVSIAFQSTTGPSNTGSRTVYLDSIMIDTVAVVLTCTARPVSNFTVAQTGLSATFTNTSTAAASYTWNFGAGATPPTAAVTTTTPIVVSYATAGQRVVSLIAHSANTTCADSVKTMSFTVTSAKNALPAIVKAYPNPNKGEFVISTQGFMDDLDYELYNPAGQLVVKGRAQADSQTKVSETNLAAGMYILRLSSTKGQRNEKLVIQK